MAVSGGESGMPPSIRQLVVNSMTEAFGIGGSSQRRAALQHRLHRHQLNANAE
jgi:hypothetical protein